MLLRFPGGSEKLAGCLQRALAAPVLAPLHLSEWGMPLWEGQWICAKVGQAEDNPRATGIFILIPNRNSDFSLKLLSVAVPKHSNSHCSAFTLTRDDNRGVMLASALLEGRCEQWIHQAHADCSWLSP